MKKLKGSIIERKRADGSVAYRAQMPPRTNLAGEVERLGETFDSYDDAHAWLVEQNAKLNGGRPDTNITLRKVISLKATSSGLKSSSAQAMQQVLSRLPETILDTPISQITPATVTQWVTEDLVKRPMKASTMLLTVGHLSSVFTWAQHFNISTIGNPVKACGASKLILRYAPDDLEYDEWTRQLGRGPVWTPEQIRRLCLSESYPYQVLFIVIALQALRRGEALGLRWATFDEENRVIRVRHNITYVGETVHVETPKSGQGRWALLDDLTFTALLQHRELQAKERSKYETWDESGWVFTKKKHRANKEWWPGIHMIPTTVSVRMRNQSKKLGFPVIGTHGLRRSWATIAERIGVSNDMRRDILGHNAPNMTERYTRPSADELRAALAAVREEIFPGWSEGRYQDLIK